MKPDPDTKLLTDPERAPTPELLESEFGKLYPLYTELTGMLESMILALA